MNLIKELWIQVTNPESVLEFKASEKIVSKNFWTFGFLPKYIQIKIWKDRILQIEQGPVRPLLFSCTSWHGIWMLKLLLSSSWPCVLKRRWFRLDSKTLSWAFITLFLRIANSWGHVKAVESDFTLLPPNSGMNKTPANKVTGNTYINKVFSWILSKM